MARELARSIAPDNAALADGFWGEISNATAKFSANTGAVFPAARLYSAKWQRERGPADMEPGGLICFNGLERPELNAYAMGVPTPRGLPKGVAPLFYSVRVLIASLLTVRNPHVLQWLRSVWSFSHLRANLLVP